MARPLTYFDDIVAEALRTGEAERLEGSEIIRVRLRNETIRIGNVLSILPNSRFGIAYNSHQLSIEVGAFLAMLDFNDRMSPFSENINQQIRDCDFYMTMRFRNAELSPIAAGRIWQDEFFYQRNDTLRSMAAVGPMRSVTAVLLALLGGLEKFSSGGAVPLISPSASSSQLDNKEIYPFFGRTAPTSKANAEALCLFLRTINIKQFAVLHVNDEYGLEYKSSILEAAKLYNLNVTAVSYKDGIRESLTNAIDQLVKLDYVYHFALFPGRESGLNLFFPALYEANLLTEDKVWIYGDAVRAVVGRQINMDEGNDRFLAKLLNRSMIFTVNEPNEQMELQKTSMAKFAQNGELVEYFLSSHVGGALDEPRALPNDVFAQRFQEAWFYTLLSYDAVMALGIAACQSNKTFPSGAELFETFKGVRFRGASGRVAFEKDTGSREFSDGQFQVVNLFAPPITATGIGKMSGVRSMEIDLADSSVKELEPLVFPDGTTTPPASLPPAKEDMNLVPPGIRGFAWGLAGFCLALSLYCAVWTYLNRRTPRVRASQPVFLILLCVGTFFMGFAIIPGTWQEPMSQKVLDVGCMLGVWLLSVGLTTTFAALFSKTWRINQVYSNAERFRRVGIRARDVLWPFALLLSVNFALLTVWTIVDPLEWERIVVRTDEFGRTIESRGTCNESGDTDGSELIFRSLLAAVNTVAVAVSGYQGYKARQLPSNFSETFYICVTNFVLLEGMILSIPILILADEDPSTYMLVMSVFIFILVLGVLLPAFVPKFGKDQNASLGRLVMSFRSEEFHCESTEPKQHASRSLSRRASEPRTRPRERDADIPVFS